MVLAGHSLGGVILFELLKRGHSLSCTPQAGDDGYKCFSPDFFGGRSNEDLFVKTLKKVYAGA